MRSIRFWIYIGMLLCLAVSTGCGKEARDESGRASESPVASGSVGRGDILRETASVSPQVPAGLPVRIIPDIPTVREDLQAVLSSETPVTYRWFKNDMPIDGEAGSRLSKARFAKGNKVSVTAITDGKESSATVTIQNSPPEVISVPFSPQYVYRGVNLTVTPKGFDADGDGVTFHYQWIINGVKLTDDAPVLKGDQFMKGDNVSVNVIPSDGTYEGNVFLTRPLVIPNAPPAFTSTPVREFKGNTYAYAAHAEDPDGDVLAYSLVGPKGMTIDAGTGEVTWQITKEGAGVHAIEITAQDSGGLRAFQKYTFTVTIP